MRGLLLFLLLLPGVFADNYVVIPSLFGIAIVSFVVLIYLYFKISNAPQKKPQPPFFMDQSTEEKTDDVSEKEEVDLENIEQQIFEQEEFSTLHADETNKPLTKNQAHIQQLRDILARQKQSRTDLYKSLHPSHRKTLHKSLHHVVQKYKLQHENLERQQDKEVEQALDAFAKLKQYHSAHKQKQVAGSIDKLRARNSSKKE